MITIIVVVAALLIIALALVLRIVEQYEAGVMCRLGRIVQVKNPGLAAIISIADRMRKSLCASSPCRSNPRGSSPKTT